MAHDVFISHSSKDKTVADATCAALESAGIRCWIAPRDILPGANWGEAIIDGITGSRVFVLILSHESNVSPQVVREVERAVSAGLPIIPLRVHDIPLSKSLQYFLSSAHWLDAYQGPLKQHLERLTASVGTFLGDEHARPAVRPPLPRRRRLPVAIPVVAAVLAAVGAVAAWQWTRPGGDRPVDAAAPGADAAAAAPAPAAAQAKWCLGVAVRDLPAIPARHFGATDGGVWVSSVLPQQKSDVRPGDVVVEVDGTRIRTPDDFQGFDVRDAASSPLQFVLLRGGTTVTVPVSPYRLDPGSQEWKSYGRQLFAAPCLGEQARLLLPKTPGAFMIDRLQARAGAVLALTNSGPAAAWRADDDPAGVELPPGLYSAGAVAPDGRLFVLARKESGELMGVNALTGKQVFLAPGHGSTRVVTILACPGGGQVLSLDEDGTLRLTDTTTQEVIPGPSLRDVASRDGVPWSPPDWGTLSPAGRYLLTRHAGEFFAWDLEQKAVARRFKPDGNVLAAAAAPDWSVLAVMLDSGLVELWDIAREERVAALRGHVGDGTWCRGDVVFLSPATLVSAYGGDDTVRFWDVRGRAPVWEYEFPEAEQVCHDPATGGLFVSGGWTEPVRRIALPDVVTVAPSVPDSRDPELPTIARQSPPVSSITVTLPGGKTREIVEAEDGSKTVTERDPAGNVARMTFVPAPGSVPLGIVFAPAAGGDADLDELPKIEEGIRVRELAAGGQAARDGVVRPGDLVTAVGVDDTAEPTPIAGLRYAEVQRLLAGKEGSTVRLRIVRDGEPAPLDVVAKRGKVQAVRRKAARSDFTNSIGMEFVAVRGGAGALGVESGDLDVRPHYVRLSRGYLIGAHEVTQAEYAAVMAAQPSAFSPGGEKAEAVTKAFAERDIPFADTAHHPVESVTWEDACEFCRRLGEREGRTYRLPTEAEWEWACRNAGATAWRGGGLSGPWIDETAVGTHLGHPGTTHPVGTRSPNDAGAYDMFGNVAEWCADRFAEDGFVTAKYVDPQGPAEGLKRVVRGGAFTDFGFKFFKRSGLGPAEKRPYIGFRVVLEPTRGLLADTAVEAELLDTSAWAVDESRIPNPIPQPDPPLRDAAEEAAELAAVQETLQSGGDLRELRKRLVASAAANQREFANLRGPWLDVNTGLGNMKTQQSVDWYNKVRDTEPESMKAVVLERARALDSLLGWVPNDMAWNLATEPDPDHRDPPIAVLRAIEACEETKWRYWGFLDTLAAALAADGRFEQAVRLGEAALERAPEAEREQLEFALERYRRGEAWAEKQP